MALKGKAKRDYMRTYMFLLRHGISPAKKKSRRGV